MLDALLRWETTIFLVFSRNPKKLFILDVAFEPAKISSFWARCRLTIRYRVYRGGNRVINSNPISHYHAISHTITISNKYRLFHLVVIGKQCILFIHISTIKSSNHRSHVFHYHHNIRNHFIHVDAQYMLGRRQINSIHVLLVLFISNRGFYRRRLRKTTVIFRVITVVLLLPVVVIAHHRVRLKNPNNEII